MFLVKATYTAAGLKGLQAEGGSRRAEVIRALVENAGGEMTGMYYALDGSDVYVLCELPDLMTAASLTIAIRTSGGLELHTSPLLTLEEIDQAVRIPVAYQPPGG